MKKILSILFAVLMLTALFSFVSCKKSDKNGSSTPDYSAYTMSDFITSLGSNYSVTSYTNYQELQYMAAQYQLDASKYGATMAISARNKSTYCTVVIIECDSEQSASTLKSDSAAVVAYLKNSYSSSYSFDAKRAGRFVLIGEVNAMNDALKVNKAPSSSGSGSSKYSMSKFINNLGNSYNVTRYTDSDQIQYMAAQYQLDASKYGTTMAISATNKSTYCMVVIIECSSEQNASVLKSDSALVVSYLEYYYSSSYTFDAKLAGKYVLIGEVSAINDALGL